MLITVNAVMILVRLAICRVCWLFSELNMLPLSANSMHIELAETYGTSTFIDFLRPDGSSQFCQ